MNWASSGADAHKRTLECPFAALACQPASQPAGSLASKPTEAPLDWRTKRQSGRACASARPAQSWPRAPLERRAWPLPTATYKGLRWPQSARAWATTTSGRQLRASFARPFSPIHLARLTRPARRSMAARPARSHWCSRRRALRPTSQSGEMTLEASAHTSRP